ADVKTLRVLDAERPQQAQGGGVLDALGDRVRTEAAREPCECLHDELVVPRSGQAADEAAVDLQILEGQVLEVLEGAEARAEVIEGDRAAQRAHARAEGTGARHVRDRRGLRYLD